MSDQTELFVAGGKSIVVSYKPEFIQLSRSQPCQYKSDCRNNASKGIAEMPHQITVDGQKRTPEQIRTSQDLLPQIKAQILKNRGEIIAVCESCTVAFMMASSEE